MWRYSFLGFLITVIVKRKILYVLQVNRVDPKHQYRVYSPPSLTNAYVAVTENNMTVRGAARQYNIPLTTLRDRVDGRVGLDVTRSGPGPILSCYSTSNLNFDNSILFYLANFLFYSILFYSILFCIFYSVFYSILLYNSLLCSILYSILFCILFCILFYSVFYSILYSILFYLARYSILFYFVIYSVNSIMQTPKFCEYFLTSLIDNLLLTDMFIIK